MISKSHRFHGLGSLRYVYKHGKTARGSVISIKYNLDERRKSYRLAVVVSKKVSKSAVVRNRIRRRVMEIIRIDADKITGPYDLVITVFDEKVANMPHDELANNLKNLLTGAGVVSYNKSK